MRKAGHLTWTWMVMISLLEFQKYNPKKIDIPPKWRDVPSPIYNQGMQPGWSAVRWGKIDPTPIHRYLIQIPNPTILRDRQARSQTENSSEDKYRFHPLCWWLLPMLIISFSSHGFANNSFGYVWCTANIASDQGPWILE